jgi:hypothetical protein
MWMTIALVNLVASGINVHAGNYGWAVVCFGVFLACLKEDT